MRHRTKADWATAKAAALRREAYALPATTAADWRGTRRRMAAQRALLGEAARFERMARGYRSKDL